jgi:hypothetical protein
MTSISPISSSLLASSQTDELLRQQQLREAQATDVLAKLTSGSAPTAAGVRAHGGHHGHHGMGKVAQSGEDAAAKALGMTSSDLKDALQSGQTLKDVAASKNVDFSKVQSTITDAVKPQLDQAVQNGRLTSHQETDLLSKLTAGDGATSSPGATYSTSGSVSQGADAGLLVNTTA